MATVLMVKCVEKHGVLYIYTRIIEKSVLLKDIINYDQLSISLVCRDHQLYFQYPYIDQFTGQSSQ